MIAIVNIDPDPRLSGQHLYSLRINAQEVAQFKHWREEPLSALLNRAFVAAFEVETNKASNG